MTCTCAIASPVERKPVDSHVPVVHSQCNCISPATPVLAPTNLPFHSSSRKRTNNRPTVPRFRPINETQISRNPLKRSSSDSAFDDTKSCRTPVLVGSDRAASSQSTALCRFGGVITPILAGTTTSPSNNNHNITLTTSTMASRGPPGARGMSNRFAQFKLVLLGESAVGKSSIVLRFVKDQFDSYRESTIGAAFLTQTISLDESTTVKFEIWDTAGQERYKSLAPMYYRNANCAVVVYDITQASSLDKAKAWVKELQRQANENIIIALAGNKLDLVTEQPDKRAIPTADAEAYAKEAGLLFFETSAKTAENVQELFTAIAKRLPLEQAGPRHGARGPGGQASRVSLAPEGANTQAGGPCSC